jgi:hypothetical protein
MKFAPERTLNPEPVTVIVLCSGPWVGATEIVRAVTVNVAGRVSFEVASSVPTTLYGPELGTTGTVNVQTNPPLESVVIPGPT